jgi:7-cyano-7-deazaguanine synthase
MSNKNAVVVLSGGQDSVTCLGLALKEYDKVFAIGFDYDQKHKVELRQASIICEKYDVPFLIMSIPMLSELGDSALISGTQYDDVNKPHHANSTLPASFVPNRNALFLTTAHAYAQKVGCSTIITGVCETDYSGYPDCREVFIESLQESLNIGYLTNIRIRTPLMRLNKEQTFKLAEKVGFLRDVIDYSHTCYNGDRSKMHPWGAGCGKCPACKLRANGYDEFIAGRNEVKGAV